MDSFRQGVDAALNRRKFLIRALASAGGLSLLGLPPLLAKERGDAHSKQYTVQEVINLILKERDLSPQRDTVDTIKAGQADQRVTGIVTTMFPTIPVIEEAARRKANFIIAHEPSFYNHQDAADWVPNNAVLKQKQQLLKKHAMAIWRFHDYAHALKPDAVSYGVAKKASWLPYYKPGQTTFTIPPLSLQDLVAHLKRSLGIEQLRIIGDPLQRCARIALLPGAWGGQHQVTVVEQEKPDVLIVGEVSEWETAEYIRDARAFGANTALVVLGHAVSEEPGMEWVADWLQPKLSSIPITHIASGNPFTWL